MRKQTRKELEEDEEKSLGNLDGLNLKLTDDPNWITQTIREGISNRCPVQLVRMILITIQILQMHADPNKVLRMSGVDRMIRAHPMLQTNYDICEP